MRKRNRTLNILLDSIQAEYTWRVKELDDFKTILLKSKDDPQKTLIRAGVTLLYAHWEGFVKTATENYYEFVAGRGLRNNELKETLVAVCLKKTVDELIQTKNIVRQTKSLEFILNELQNRAVFPTMVPIGTHNLTYDMFEEYCMMLSISTEGYELKRHFIDKKLVENRHLIAHGKYLRVDLTTFKDIYEMTLLLLNSVKTDIMNSATMERYKK